MKVEGILNSQNYLVKEQSWKFRGFDRLAPAPAPSHRAAMSRWIRGCVFAFVSATYHAAHSPATARTAAKGTSESPPSACCIAGYRSATAKVPVQLSIPASAHAFAPDWGGNISATIRSGIGPSPSSNANTYALMPKSASPSAHPAPAPAVSATVTAARAATI